MQHEFKAPRSVRSGKREAWASGVAEHFCIATEVPGILKVKDEPAFAEGRAAEFDAELVADETAPAVACDQIRRGDFGQTSVCAPQDKINPVRSLAKVDQF